MKAQGGVAIPRQGNVIIIFFASTIWISYVNALQQKYADLRQKGLLTEEEFQKLKADHPGGSGFPGGPVGIPSF
ncbi:MAG TPA: SHOCT domain-containing protein [Candidatus Eisenbacteria bacterium]|nr:SHOCT domain-containing protein [Candidatus Eisenbacteria bacterium]